MVHQSLRNVRFGHSRPDRARSKPGHVRHTAESGSGPDSRPDGLGRYPYFVAIRRDGVTVLVGAIGISNRLLCGPVL